MLERLSWKSLLWECVICIIPAAILGWLMGYISWFLLAAVLGLLGWHCYNQLRLFHWLWIDRSMTPPTGLGSWEPLFSGLYQMQRRNRRRRRELALLIKRFRSGAESLPDAMVVTTDEGNIFWCNDLAQHLLGLRWPEDNGQQILNLLRYPEVADYLKKGEFFPPLTMQLNSGRFVEFRIMPYSEGQLLMVVRDVTQNRLLEGFHRNFLANASHELRTPLTVLSGYLEMMNDESLLAPRRRQAINTMQEQVKRMSSLVTQLLTLSKIEATLQIDLNEIVDMSCIFLGLEQEANSLSQGQHEIIFRTEKGLNVFGNQEQLRSAVSNLVYNAVNHTEPGTKIEISWQRTPQGAQFLVSDNGAGIALEHIERLTERFYRVDKSRSRHRGGSGLGLAIVKHVLHHYEVKLNIISEVGLGSRFFFTLPPHLIASTVRDKDKQENVS